MSVPVRRGRRSRRRLATLLALVSAAVTGGCDNERLTRVATPAPDSGPPAASSSVPTPEPLPAWARPTEAEAASGTPDAGAADSIASPADSGSADGASSTWEPPPPAAQPVYINTGVSLYSFDPQAQFDPRANPVTHIGDFRDTDLGIPLTDMVDIAIDHEGRLYGGTAASRIYRIHPLTAACRFLFHLPFDRPTGLTALGDGRLVVSGPWVSVVALNARGGQDTRRALAELVNETSGDIVALPDGKLYATVQGEGGDDLVRIELPRIDGTTGVVTVIGNTGVSGVFGLAYSRGMLLGFTESGTALILDQNSGRALFSTSAPGQWWGATTNPVLW